MATLRLATRTLDGAIYQGVQQFSAEPPWTSDLDAENIATSFGVPLSSITMLDFECTDAEAKGVVAALSSPSVTLPKETKLRAVVPMPPRSVPAVLPSPAQAAIDKALASKSTDDILAVLAALRERV